MSVMRFSFAADSPAGIWFHPLRDGGGSVRGSAKKARLVHCEEDVVTLLVQELAVEAG